MRSAVLFALLATGFAADLKVPLISTELLFETKDFIYDCYDAAWTNFVAAHYAKHSPVVKKTLTDIFTEDPVKQACDKVGLQKNDVMAKYTQVETSVLQVKATMMQQLSKARGPVDEAAAKGVEQFEKAMPAWKGTIGKTAPEVLLVAVYFLVVLYITMKVALIAFRICFGLFCCICCCGCCRSKAKRDHGHHGHQGKHHARHEKHDAKADAKPKAGADAKGKPKKGK